MSKTDAEQPSALIEKLEGPLMWVLLAVLFAVVVSNAWVGDDSHITFRVLDNFVNGYGLRWNPVERVQVYTHPLWMMLMLPFYAVTLEGFYTSIGIALVCTAAALCLVGLRVARSPRSAAIVTAALLGSSAFVDYSTSGLENSVTHLLLALFFWILLTGSIDRSRLLLLSMIACGGLLNRLDTALLFLPPLAVAALRLDVRSAARAVALGFVPLVVWECFSVFYYGSPFPNTAYAKLGTGIPRFDLVRQGLYYYLDSLKVDPLTLLVTVAGLVYALTRRCRKFRAAAVGILLYLIYTAYIGGDFMSGRFFAAPCWVAAILLARRSWRDARIWAAGLAAVLIVGVTSDVPPALAWTSVGAGKPKIREHGIADEQAFFAPKSSLAARLKGVSQVLWQDNGLEARERGRPMVVMGVVGATACFAGPNVHVIDRVALADPLLSRLPCSKREWRIGHFDRFMPAGYLESIAFGQNMIQDPHLRRVYAAILKVTRGNLLDPGRLAEIWRLNTGYYRQDLRAYIDNRAADRKLMLDAAAWKRMVADQMAEASTASDAAVWNALAVAHQDEGNLVIARLANLKALQLAPDSKPIADDHYRIGLYFLEAKHEDLATETFREIVALCPGHLAAQRQLGRLYYAAGQFDKAADYLEQSVELDPGDADACFIQGITYQKMGRLVEAEAAYKAAVAADSSMAKAHNNLGTVYLALGQYEAAIQSLKAAVVADPGYADAYLNLGTACRRIGRIREARVFYRKTLSLNIDEDVRVAVRSWLAANP